MIYLLIAHLIIGSFMAGAFYEHNDRDSSLHDILAYLFALVFGTVIIAITLIQYIYRWIVKVIDQNTPIIFLYYFYFTKRYNNLSPEKMKTLEDQLANCDTKSLSDRTFRWCLIKVKERNK